TQDGQTPAGELDPASGPIPGNACGSDLPARFLRTAGCGSDRAGRVNRIDQFHLVSGAGAANGSDPASALKHDEQVLDRAVLERFGEIDPVADQLVTRRVDRNDVALRNDALTLAIPVDAVRGEIVAVRSEE